MTAPRTELPRVLHRAELLADGISDDEIKRARGAGTWTSVHRGAYCRTESLAGLSPEQRFRLQSTAVAARSPSLALSHLSAAVMLGLPLCGAPLDRVHLTRSGDGGGRATPGRVVHVGALPPTEVGRVSGTLVTSPVRTLIDVACGSSFLTTVVAADAALRRQLVSPVELSTALDRTRRRRGAAAARRALRFADGRSESVGESYTRVAMHQARLPTPELQISIFGPGGTFIARTDLGYPAWGVLIEFDGAIKYSKLLAPGQRAEDVVLAEKRREDRLRDLGYVVVRLAWNELADPAAIAERITAALDRGRRVVDGTGLTGSWSAAPAIRIAG